MQKVGAKSGAVFDLLPAREGKFWDRESGSVQYRVQSLPILAHKILNLPISQKQIKGGCNGSVQIRRRQSKFA